MTVCSTMPMQVNAIDRSTNVGGYEVALFPASVMNISQGIRGGSHLYGFAIDLVSITDIKAPFTGTIKRIYEDCNTVWLESIDPVLFADGTIDYMVVSFTHDDDISDLKFNQLIHQGDVFYQAGNKGESSGTHVHLEVGKGRFYGRGWTKHPTLNTKTEKIDDEWRINNGIHPINAFYVESDVNILNDKNYNWKFYNIQEPLNGDLTIDNVDKVAEKIVLRNNSQKFLEIRGSKIKSDKDSSWYEINKNYIIGPGMSVTIGSKYSGSKLQWPYPNYRLNNLKKDNVYFQYPSGNGTFTWYDQTYYKPGQVYISKIDKSHELVYIRNMSTVNVPLEGFKFKSERDSTYFLFHKITLKAGSTITLGMGKSKPTVSWGYNIYRLNNTTREDCVLYDSIYRTTYKFPEYFTVK